MPKSGSRIRRTRVLTLFYLLLLGGCSRATTPLPTAQPVHGLPPLLTWVSEFTRPAGTAYPALQDSSRYGSISGLARDAETNQWIGVIDDRDSRVAWLAIDFSGSQMTVTPTRLMRLTAGPGVNPDVATKADLEAIAALPDGTFLMSEEGHLTTAGGIFQPAILHVTREGVVTDVVSYPEDFLLRPDQTRGLRDNQGFEGLTRMPDGRLIAALEQPLIQDGPVTSFEHGGRGRLVEFTPRRGGGFRVHRQWWYPIEPTPRVEGYPQICSDGENGVSEILAITNTLLLSMERACLEDPQAHHVTNTVQIFAVELGRADVRKTLVLDLSTLTDRVLSKELAHLENFEAMAFGPTATNGTRTLLVASDDNFRATQKTSFLLFGLRMVTR